MIKFSEFKDEYAPLWGEYDVVVVGGGMAGTGAAVAAARAGAKTILVENTSALGGLATMGIVNIPLDFLSGLGQELFDRLNEINGLRKRNSNPEKHKLVFDRMVRESGCELLLVTPLVDTIVDGDTVKGIVVHTKEGRRSIMGKRFIDASGDSDLVYFAGGEVEVGREKDHMSMGCSLEFVLGGVDYDKYMASELRNKDPKWIRFLMDAIEKGLIPLSKQVAPMDTSNGNMMYCGGILSGFAAIVSEENIDEIYPYLLPGLLTMHNALDIYAYSGNTEGHYYTDYGLKTFMPSVGHLYRTTKLDGIINHEFFTEILPYWTIMWAAGGTGAHPNYSDSASLAAYMKIPMAVLSKLTNDPLIDGFLINAGGIGSAFNNLVYLKPDPKPEYLSDYAAVIENFGYGALRTGFADDDMLLVLKANDSQSGHNHYDQNSIQFSIGQNWLIRDPGAGSYYYADRSFWTHNGHSTIMVDGNAQMIKGLSTTKLVFPRSVMIFAVTLPPSGVYFTALEA